MRNVHTNIFLETTASGTHIGMGVIFIPIGKDHASDALNCMIGPLVAVKNILVYNSNSTPTKF